MWKYLIFLVAVDDNAFLYFLQTIELYNIALQLSKNTAWMFMAMLHGSRDKSLLLFLIESSTQTGNINMIPAQQLVQNWRMQTQVSVTHIFLMLYCLYVCFHSSDVSFVLLIFYL